MNIRPSCPDWEDRDRLVLSKGHSCPIVYAALARKGYFNYELLRTLRHIDSMLQGHPDCRKTPGIDMTTGSLGQGLSMGLGMALGAKKLGKKFQVYVLLSDGELQEGMTWEAAMASSHYNVGNLTAIVDYNNLQVDGHIYEIMNIEPLMDKWQAFGWKTLLVENGNNIASLLGAFSARQREKDSKKPYVIICKTTKGKGVSFMEDVMEWHASSISKEQKDQAIKEIRAKLSELESHS